MDVFSAEKKEENRFLLKDQENDATFHLRFERDNIFVISYKRKSSL